MMVLLGGKSALAGHAIGNGGDHIRATFLQMGTQVMQYLRTTEAGAALLARAQIPLLSLEASLTTAVVSVEFQDLRDNTGSLVDAIGEPGRIVLSRSAWAGHFEASRDLYYLVFHEMLRATGVDDDDYRVSRHLYPFSREFWLESRLVPYEPLIESDLLLGVIDPTQVVFGGVGCQSMALGSGSYFDFDVEKNEATLTLHRASAYLGPLEYRSAEGSSNHSRFEGAELVSALRVARTQCGISIPLQAPQGKRVVLTQVDLQGNVRLADDTQSVLQFEAFLPGDTAEPRLSRTILGPEQGRFLMRRTSRLVTACGGSTNLRLSASARVQSTEGRASVDLQKIRLSLALESCEEGVSSALRAKSSRFGF
jgi:hypothetical protein